MIPSLTLGPAVPRSTREVERFTKAELTLPVFQMRWSSHVPIIVSAVHLEFQVSWSPRYFIEHYGNNDCEVEDCETGESVPDFTVARFFSGFGEPRPLNSPILRLKVGVYHSYHFDSTPAIGFRIGHQKSTSTMCFRIFWTISCT